MGKGTWSLRSLLNKVDAGEVYLRTHEAAGIGRDGHGREHSSDLPTMRGTENEGGSQPSSQSETSKIKFIGIEEVENTTAFWKGKQMEKANGRNNSPANYNWRGFLESAQKSMEAAATRDGDPIVNAVKIAQVASTLYDMTIRPQDVAKLLHCAALVVSSNDLTNNDKHRRVVATGTILAELSQPQGDPDLAQLRVVSEIANQFVAQA